MILRKLNIPDENAYLNNIQEANNDLINHLLAYNFVLPAETPVEIHPYIDTFELRDYDKYIIGTFPPISYLNDNQILIDNGIHQLSLPNGRLIPAPLIPFYHGNRNSMWDILLDNIQAEQIFNNPDRLDARQNLIDFLHNNSMNYSDIIYSTRRKKYSSEDKVLQNIVIYATLFKQILNNNSAKRLLFNTSSIFGVSGLSVHVNNNVNPRGRININGVGSFDLFLRGLQDLGAKVELALLTEVNQAIFDWIEVNAVNAVILKKLFKTKIIIKTRISISANNTIIENTKLIQKEYFVITPFSPAAINRGSLKANPIVNNYPVHNPGETSAALLKLIYKAFVRFNYVDQEYLINLNH